MPWKKTRGDEPRWLFVSSVLEHRRSFSRCCRDHGISRETGHKWWRRFLREGREGLRERSRAPKRFGRASAAWVHAAVRKLRRRYPTWGARKLRVVLQKQHPRRNLPCARTLERWLPKRAGPARRLRGPLLCRSRFRAARAPNEVWTIDFKGWFRTRDGSRICPLTVRDHFSWYLLLVRHVAVPSDRVVRAHLQELFRRFGLPRVMRMDNGSPFGGNGALGLSTLSTWLLRLGVKVEFGRPATPGDHAHHEQMHRILKKDTASPPAPNQAAQLRRLQRWQKTYNQDRPHHALGMTPPAQHYRRSSQRFPARLPDWRYPSDWTLRKISRGGWIQWEGRRRLIGRAFAHQRVALRLQRRFHSVWMGPHLLGHLHPGDAGGLRPSRPAR